jgi:hypothetical protein
VVVIELDDATLQALRQSLKPRYDDDLIQIVLTELSLELRAGKLVVTEPHALKRLVRWKASRRAIDRFRAAKSQRAREERWSDRGAGHRRSNMDGELVVIQSGSRENAEPMSTHDHMRPAAIIAIGNTTKRLARFRRMTRARHYGHLAAVYTLRLRAGDAEWLASAGDWAAEQLGRIAGWIERATNELRSDAKARMLPAVLDALRPADRHEALHLYTVASFDFIATSIARTTKLTPNAIMGLMKRVVECCYDDPRNTKNDRHMFERMNVPVRFPNFVPLPKPRKEPAVSERDREWHRRLTQDEIRELALRLRQAGRLETPWMNGRIEVLSLPPKSEHDATPPADPTPARSVRRMIVGRTPKASLLSVVDGTLIGELPVPAVLADGESIDVLVAAPPGVIADDVWIEAPLEKRETGVVAVVFMPLDDDVPDGLVDATIALCPPAEPLGPFGELAELDGFPTDDSWCGITIGPESLRASAARWLRSIFGSGTVGVTDDGLAVGLGASSDEAAGVLELDAGAAVHFEIRHRGEGRIVAWDVRDDLSVRPILELDLAGARRAPWTIEAGARGDHLIVVAAGDEEEVRVLAAMMQALDPATLPEVARELHIADARCWRYRTR